MIAPLKIRRFYKALKFIAAITAVNFGFFASSESYATSVPSETSKLVSSLTAAQWQELENGLQVIRAITVEGVVMTAFRISPDNFTFSIELHTEKSGSRARKIGEEGGAVVTANAGFFAAQSSGSLYSVGYLRLGGEVLSKGWSTAGGILSFKPDGLQLSPSHQGIPSGEFDAIQSKPMLIEPGGKWAMSSNAGEAKPRTIICTLENGEVIISTISRTGLSLFEAGWVMRSKEKGGFFGCDSALAFDGGRSTQMWYSGAEKYSSIGISPVHNFFVVRPKVD